MNQKETLSSSQPFYTQHNIKVLHLYSGGGRITGRALVSDTGDSSGSNASNCSSQHLVTQKTQMLFQPTETSVTDERRVKKIINYASLISFNLSEFCCRR